MSVGALSPQQLRSIVEDKWERDEDALAVGLHVAAPWAGPDEVEFDFGKARVVRADTVFEVRQALRDAEKAEGPDHPADPVAAGRPGHDVVARLARSRLFAIDHWASLCALFRAKELDRSICDPAVAQALLEHAPPDGYPPVSAGVLDAGTVWRALSRHVFDMGESEPDLVSLLLWAATRSGPARYLAAPPELRDSLRQRLVAGLGDAADSILRFIESGAGADALALAVACEVVFGEGTRTRRSRPPPPGWSSTTTTSRSPRRRAGPGPGRRRRRSPSWTAGTTPRPPSATSSGPTSCSGSSAARTTPTAAA